MSVFTPLIYSPVHLSQAPHLESGLLLSFKRYVLILLLARFKINNILFNALFGICYLLYKDDHEMALVSEIVLELVEVKYEI